MKPTIIAVAVLIVAIAPPAWAGVHGRPGPLSQTLANDSAADTGAIGGAGQPSGHAHKTHKKTHPNR